MKKFLVFVGMIILYTTNATAETDCPTGCFCLNNGKYDNTYSIGNSCSLPATMYTPNPSSGFSSHYGNIVLSSSPDDFVADFYATDFRKLYLGATGFYGFIGDEFIYANTTISGFGDNSSAPLFDHIFQCPVTHPNSASGAKALNDCFKYDANGNKIYYGAGQTIHCNAGTYLPGGATSCVACNTSQNQICPGGNFERSDTVQGLRVNCNPGEYLPANATQCNTCDNNNYSCSGGLYEFNANIDQGQTIQHNGYINATNSNGGLHNYTACQPGQYMPATSNTCTACTGDYACPGGIFYTDATYNKDRGRILCSYGTANNTHTSCISQSSDPLFAKGKRSPNITTSNTQTNTINNNIKTTTQSTGPTTVAPVTMKLSDVKTDSTTSSPLKKLDFGNLSSIFSADKAAVHNIATGRAALPTHNTRGATGPRSTQTPTTGRTTTNGATSATRSTPATETRINPKTKRIASER